MSPDLQREPLSGEMRMLTEHGRVQISVEEAADLLITEGATDDEIWKSVGKDRMPFAKRRALEAHVYLRRESWREVVEAYVAVQDDDRQQGRAYSHPTVAAVADRLGVSAEALRQRVRRAGCASWPEVRARIAMETLNKGK